MEIKENMSKELMTLLRPLWHQLYGDKELPLLVDFVNELDRYKQQLAGSSLPQEWYKDVVVYSLYVDLFNEDFRGLEDKLPYLKELGVSCLWLLPILDSPMRDAGFDIRDYRRIRNDLLPEEEGQAAFVSFVDKAHEQGLRVIFDIAINHTSETHPWFQESRKSRSNPYRDYYIWRDQPDQYLDARIIFQGIEESNWKQAGNAWFFHRFFDFQPDLNYRNPRVLLDMCRNFLFWLERRVDGFRADAIPYLWKEEGTDCENLPHTHTIVKFFRQVLDYVQPNTLLLAEACQKPHEVVKYFGSGDECHAGYHFPLMPQIFKAIASEQAEPVMRTLSEEVTPAIPQAAQWFTFLRCHDELSLELVYVTEEDRKYIHDAYCRQPLWNFREGQGISARLAELMERDPRRIGLAFSIMLSLPGTPVIYYGDEFGKLNDEAYYNEQIREVGKDDTRFLVRGRLQWEEVEKELSNPASLTAQVYSRLKNMLRFRSEAGVFGRGNLKWLPVTTTQGVSLNQVLAYRREWAGKSIICLHNLSGKAVTMGWSTPSIEGTDALGQEVAYDSGKKELSLPAWAYCWIND